MGYDTDRFTSAINDALTCCICRDVLEDPVQAPCEHAYCRTCIEAWLVHETTCPEDRRPLSYSGLRPLFRYMKNDLNRLQLKCKNEAYGCESIVSLETLEAHERDCIFDRHKCPNDRCSFFANRQEVESHVKRCEYGRKECPNGCGMLLARPVDLDHNCIQELKTCLEVLRSEFACKFDDQRQDIELRLDTQRNHMIQREAGLQSQMDALKTENSRLELKVKSLMDIELERRQDIEKLKLENKELTELLRKTSAMSELRAPRKLQRSLTFRGKESHV
ncbi:RING finger protein 151-like [Ruditapes philippinarum]|uniref:RING finger protein 151-like n=1 Tax=Ruditapes philippinarum TaxID=129788 RepID=UPI00295B8634|nr:RING finger protein 151-like [Ruditapes philippinarum]XP_060564477.1 RING finger protein 151-like [Ruditapes philippinarum]